MDFGEEPRKFQPRKFQPREFQPRKFQPREFQVELSAEATLLAFCKLSDYMKTFKITMSHYRHVTKNITLVSNLSEVDCMDSRAAFLVLSNKMYDENLRMKLERVIGCPHEDVCSIVVCDFEVKDGTHTTDWRATVGTKQETYGKWEIKMERKPGRKAPPLASLEI